MPHSEAQRTKRDRRRLRWWILAGAVVTLLLAVGLRRVPEGAIGITDSWLREPRVVGGGMHWVAPAVESLTVLDPYERDGTLLYTTPEGAVLDLHLRVALRLTPEDARELLVNSGNQGSVQRLDGAIDAAVAAALGESTVAGSIPELDARQQRAVRQALGRFGRLEGEPRVSYDERSPVTLAIRENMAWHEIRQHRRQTGNRILLIGLDGADWQTAEPLIRRGLLPNLKQLRDRGTWGSIKTLTPVLSPLLWTSVATGVTADRHGVLDFLVRDAASGRLVPVNSRFRKVRALWNVFSKAGLTTDIVAWWATWPAEPIRGHLVTDRVAYSLFDYGIPAGGLGTTHPSSYFEEIRDDLVTETEITYDHVRRFVDIPSEEFRALRAELERDRKSAVRQPVNHLAKVLASTRNYHHIALDLIRRRQADLVAVYYQGIDEVGHRFMHFMPPRLEGIDADDMQRYGRAVEEFYVYQDELLGELLRAA
ncbi:MAG: alkaline phosphatase family protein, partial [Planctomycetota bacterium]